VGSTFRGAGGVGTPLIGERGLAWGEPARACGEMGRWGVEERVHGRRVRCGVALLMPVAARAGGGEEVAELALAVLPP